MRYARLNIFVALWLTSCSSSPTDCKRALMLLDVGDDWCRRVAAITASKTCASSLPGSIEEAADLQSCRNVTAPPLFASCLALTGYEELTEQAQRTCMIPRFGF